MNQTSRNPESGAGHSGIIFNIAIIAIAIIIFLFLSYLYRKNDFFHSLFEGNVTAPTQTASENDIREAAKAVESMNRTAANYSFYILVFIVILQTVAFLLAAKVFAGLKRSKEALAILIVLILSFLYRKNDFFRSLFEGNVTAPTQMASENDIREAAKNVEQINRTAAHLSFVILTVILILQAVAFMLAAKVFAGLKRSTEAVSVRLKKLENADIFLDLPLYFGLLGTVSSFIVMSFNPNISRLIAYSSTLVGIIFSVILRLVFQYPLKQKLITASAELNGKESEQ